jgi:hypothetical protein
MAIQTPYRAPFSRRNVRVTARHNIQYAADDVLGVFLVSIYRPCYIVCPSSSLCRAVAQAFLTTNLEKTPKHTKILKLYGEANAVFSGGTAK